MSIIYEQTPGGLYPTGQRTVSTFPSGLIRVDQSFACKTSAAATHRATLAVGAIFPGDSDPAIDGLKIFPEPQEKRRNDGFTEFTVSGYGRTSMNGILTKKKKINTILGLRYSSDSISYKHTFSQENPAIYQDYPANTKFLQTSVDSSVQIRRYENQAIQVKSSIGATIYKYPLLFVVYRNRLNYLLGGTLYSEIKSYEESNFGDFKEATVLFESNALEVLTATATEIKEP